MLDEMNKASDGKLSISFQDPMSQGQQLTQRLQQEYGFRPMTMSLASDDRFYFHLLLEREGQTVPVRLPEELEASALREAIKSGLERFGGGFQKTIAVYQPQQGRGRGMRMRSRGAQYRNLLEQLRSNATVTQTDLTSGRVPSNADLLMVLAPESLSDKQRFAIDQFLMRGGTVVMAASPMKVSVDQRQGVQVKNVTTGLSDWLSRYGIRVGSSMVLDPESGSLVLPKRTASGQVRMQTIDYPYFLDVRANGLADVPMLGDLRQVTMAWSSPVSIGEANGGKLEQKLPEGVDVERQADHAQLPAPPGAGLQGTRRAFAEDARGDGRRPIHIGVQGPGFPLGPAAQGSTIRPERRRGEDWLGPTKQVG
jgi:ABC-2 type transport system permease protein